jgi:acetyl esterase/lipase
LAACLDRCLDFTKESFFPAETLPEPAGNLTIIKNLTYSEVSGKPLLLDLYLPQNTPKSLPTIIWIHGGAWKIGSKADCPGSDLANHGYAVACINYRLSGVAKFPAQIHDVKASVRWLRANSKKYNLDPNNFGATGESAGGHLAALLGTSGGVPELEGPQGNLNYSSKVKAVCDWFGPTDLLSISPLWSTPNIPLHQVPYMDLFQAVQELIGKPNQPLQKNDYLLAWANPISHISPDDPPFLIMHGDQDITVPYNQSILLYQALNQSGLNVTYHQIKGAGHGFPAEYRKNYVIPFFDKHLKK